MNDFFGGVLVPTDRDFRDLESGTRELRRFSKHAIVDHFKVDLDRGLICLGPLARVFHRLPVDDEFIGIGRFLDAYRDDERRELLSLIERFAREQSPFHYTARLSGRSGRFVHGFVAPPDDGGDADREWSGVLVMSRRGLAHDRGAGRLDA
ncbi:hypothetical protein [Oricola thermophila]|uniref:PAS domain-containing protein n=1 Tax=Oricola thermophila TaxID=2742145 RepID=A0A6N1VFU8_9HYPH|nr:hypothetical protein [Oricola thermophila]QKV19658.1 hypothetical protein HTY61_14945 [Oricola thermophila]